MIKYRYNDVFKCHVVLFFDRVGIKFNRYGISIETHKPGEILWYRKWDIGFRPFHIWRVR